MKEKSSAALVKNMPLLPLRGLVLFPGMQLHFDVGRKKSILALNAAMDRGQTIFLIAQKDMKNDDPAMNDLFHIGVVAQVRQVLRLPGDSVRVLVEGMYRASVAEVFETKPFFQVSIKKSIEIRSAQSLHSVALARGMQAIFAEYADLSPKIPPDVLMGVAGTESPGQLADFIASNTMLKMEDKQSILTELRETKRLEKLMLMIQNENEILGIEKIIQEKLHEQVDKNQREYYLREQIKVISNELGEGENPQEESNTYKEKIYYLGLPKDTEDKLLKEAERLMKMPFGSHEGAVIRNYLDQCIDLPWHKTTHDHLDLALARKSLDRDHFGMDKVKERIIEMLAVRKLSPDIKGQIICLVGPPGVGKTSIAKSIAKAMGRKYARISLGGVRDEAEIRGHRKTYIGAMPGGIIAAIKQAGSSNPLILLDEIDKLSNDVRGDPMSALLEVLDAEQNNAFRDHFLEIPFNLSNVLFITTANNADAIPTPLYDRMEIIDLSSYTHEEKFNIARNHLIRKQLKKHGLTAKQCKITDGGLNMLIEGYTKEAGVRTLERMLASVCRKVAKSVAGGEVKSVTVSEKTLEKMIGHRKFKPEDQLGTDEVGVVTGLAWTAVGGVTMPIEVAILDGKGRLELTGSLGDIMKESARAAISYIRVNAERLHIPKDFYKTNDIHIHVPEGAVPKDGPSAGVTIATALVSALSGLKARADVAMTGEITLRGRVLAIGGLKEKSMAAYRSGIKTIVIPKANQPDLDDISDAVNGSVQFVTAGTLDTVLDIALIKPAIADEHMMEAPLPVSLVGGKKNIQTVIAN